MGKPVIMGQAPTRIEDRYFMQKVKLGQGAFGTVWRGVDRNDQSVVAIKQLDKTQLLHRGMLREDVNREIKVMNTCKHQNVIKLIGTFEDARNIYLIQEYCDGGDFGDKLKERGTHLQEHEASNWMRDI